MDDHAVAGVAQRADQRAELLPVTTPPVDEVGGGPARALHVVDPAADDEAVTGELERLPTLGLARTPALG